MLACLLTKQSKDLPFSFLLSFFVGLVRVSSCSVTKPSSSINTAYSQLFLIYMFLVCSKFSWLVFLEKLSPLNIYELMCHTTLNLQKLC